MNVILLAMPPVFARAEPVIKNAEGFSAAPYLCPAGKPTIGWGTTRYPNGARVEMTDMAIGETVAQRCLEFSMRRVWADLAELLTQGPTINEAAAMLSLAYNVGVGAHDGVKGDLADSTLLADFNAGRIQEAADEFTLWNKAHINGVLTVLPGLTERRVLERSLFLSVAT